MDEFIIMDNKNEIFLDNLHRTLRFVCNNKTIKEGKLILFNFNDFYYSFTLDVSGVKKHFKLPMAYSITDCTSAIHLDYTLKTLCYGIDDFEFSCRMIKPKSKNNLYDNVVDVVFV
jgi:hypothetical protein